MTFTLNVLSPGDMAVALNARFCNGWQWTSHQILKIVGCACAGNVGNVFPTTEFKGNRAVMHVGIANPRWRGKRSRYSRRMRNPQFFVSDKRPMVGILRTSSEIAFEWIPQDFTDDKLTLAQAIAWCRQVTSDYLNQYVLNHMSTGNDTKL